MNDLPLIIQGGMGVAVSDWRLASAVSKLGQLGVVSGTALDQVFARRLQDGDPGSHMRRAIASFPFPEMARRVWDRWFIEGGREPNQPYKRPALPEKYGPREFHELCIVANFAEVTLAREGHDRPVGINYLEKIQLHFLPSVYGAMLAGVSYVLMGAGIPLKAPGVLDAFSRHQPASYPLAVIGAREGDDTLMHFDPRSFAETPIPDLRRPRFLAIIASNALAVTLARKANGHVDGFVIEGPVAGGHNAPPRGKPAFNDLGEPVYGERDVVDLDKMRELGLPFWLAGGFGSPSALQSARDAGAAGIQVGTAFAFCDESGLLREYKDEVLREVALGRALVRTDAVASPTGFPFKVVQLEGSVSDQQIYSTRPRICDLGYLREAYRTEDGGIGYRCSAEPQTVYESKGGKPESTFGRKCLCNALMANVGLGQVRNGYREKALLTSGDGLAELAGFLPNQGFVYSAADVVNNLLSGPMRPDLTSLSE